MSIFGKVHFQGGLYPTVAISDAFNTACHLYAASVVAQSNVLAAYGFFLVALASGLGTVRFAFSESMFAQVNLDMAEVAAFVGLPLIGMTSLRPFVLSVLQYRWPWDPTLNVLCLMVSFLLILCVTS